MSLSKTRSGVPGEVSPELTGILYHGTKGVLLTRFSLVLFSVLQIVGTFAVR